MRPRRPITRILMFLFALPAKLLRGIARTLLFPFRVYARERQSPRMMNFVHGLPALLVFVGAVFLLLVGWAQTDELEEHYKSLAARAYYSKDYDSARLYLERLTTLSEDDEDARFDLAMTLEKLGESGRALSLMKELAPPEKPGHARANLWMAEKILGNPKLATDQQAIAAAMLHLKRAISRLPNDRRCNLLVGRLLLQNGQAKEALPHLEIAAEGRPEMLYDLALPQTRYGNRDDAIRSLKSARGLLEKRLREQDNDHAARVRLAAIHFNLGDIEKAETTLKTGLRQYPKGPYQKALADFLVSTYDEQSKSKPRFEDQLLKLRNAIALDPTNARAVVRLIHFCKSDEKTKAKVKTFVQELLVNGTCPDFAHFALGTIAWHDDDQKRGIWHLERSFQLNKRFAPCGNNLAWALCQQDPPDLKRAKQIIDEVLKQWPNHANYLDTRGHILLRLGEHKAALNDLEKALVRLKNNPRLHTDLATIYDKLNKPELAKRHREIAKKLTKP